MTPLKPAFRSQGKKLFITRLLTPTPKGRS
jgi:hypothetical protein